MSGLSYQKPPQEILDLVDVSIAPLVRMNSERKVMVLLERDMYKTLEDISEKEIGLGGLQINPKTNISSRISYIKGLKIQDIATGEIKTVQGLPEQPRIAMYSWSPDEQKIAFTHTTLQGVELWLLNVETAESRKISSRYLNANIGSTFTWARDSQSLFVKYLPLDKQPLVEDAIPSAPSISENSEGTKAQNRTYQDLLQNPLDEANFEQITRSEIYKVGINGDEILWKSAGMYKGLSCSPNGKYIMVLEMHKPFSYLVPFQRFPYDVNIYTTNGVFVKCLAKVPLVEELPKGFMAVRQGVRNISWRPDQAPTIYWVEALDEGDPEKEVPNRDAVYQLAAPFDKEKELLYQTKDRFYAIKWGKEDIAVIYDYWWTTRNLRASLFNPSDTNSQARELYSRNFQDRYNSPGELVTEKNEWGKQVLSIVDNCLYLQGEGLSEIGKRPFIDELDIETLEKKRLWRANPETGLEQVVDVLDVKEGLILTCIEAPTIYPNYYYRNIKTDTLTPLTNFPNPFASMEGIYKEIITYKREDGVELSATLYLPADYDRDSKEKLPLIMWAYPKEFKDKNNAGQITSDAQEFIFPYYGSPIYWVMRGYAILDEVAFPIVGERDEEPNDTFIQQLVGSAKAAIDAVDNMGYIDRNKVAVGGHSYGAFMTANLLTHSDLFVAGIARSGAYNRTLTPFGFQSEERHYWDAPNVYYDMSPFSHADKMKTPLLLIHGEEDKNSGTYPMQSKRYFNALKGLGATVRLVMLPKEGHSYAAKASILHLLWEQDRWLEMYVKNTSK